MPLAETYSRGSQNRNSIIEGESYQHQIGELSKKEHFEHSHNDNLQSQKERDTMMSWTLYP